MAGRGKRPPPGFPRVSGDYALTEAWSIRLPEQFARRIEDGEMVLWRPGLTIRLIIWNNDHGETRAHRLRSTQDAASPERFDERETSGAALTRYSYRLRDRNDDGSVEAVHGFVFSDDDQVELAVYFDDPAEEALARSLAEAVAPRPKA
jgi:hypothetical protein